ncbi:hypothetical protein GDO86_004611 [Hymenochirus boettgeri]|uniref:Uncharacterized protein n=1 Tax=Hymenochirus boettgeri TaxID=247094 RepID=A0A8T2K6P3_9PIPI|nr:hypothetical protein GDO86_004611 [Hymenochirus boettgeri]
MGNMEYILRGNHTPTKINSMCILEKKLVYRTENVFILPLHFLQTLMRNPVFEFVIQNSRSCLKTSPAHLGRSNIQRSNVL